MSKIEQWHQQHGYDLPCPGLTRVFVEYFYNRPCALIEYPVRTVTLRAGVLLRDLARRAGLPAFVCVADPVEHTFTLGRVTTPVAQQTLSKSEYQQYLHDLRDNELWWLTCSTTPKPWYSSEPERWYSRWHRELGAGYPCFDLDCIAVAGNRAQALIEYKHVNERAQYHTNVQTLGALGDLAGLPVYLVRYDPACWQFDVAGVNELAQTQQLPAHYDESCYLHWLSQQMEVENAA